MVGWTEEDYGGLVKCTKYRRRTTTDDPGAVKVEHRETTVSDTIQSGPPPYTHCMTEYLGYARKADVEIVG